MRASRRRPGRPGRSAGRRPRPRAPRRTWRQPWSRGRKPLPSSRKAARPWSPWGRGGARSRPEASRPRPHPPRLRACQERGPT
eukprot:scaffold2599_cov74-Phaeocystis_antarctica.AAC.1